MRSSGDSVRRRAACSIAPGSSDPGSLPLLHNLHTPQPAPCCVAGTKSLPTASLLVAASQSVRPQPGSTTHSSTAFSSAVAACPLRAHVARSPAAPALLHGAPCGAPIPRDKSPTGVAASCRCARTRPPAACCRDVARMSHAHFGRGDPAVLLILAHLSHPQGYCSAPPRAVPVVSALWPRATRNQCRRRSRSSC